MICGKLDGWRQIDGVHGLEAGFEFLERSNLAALAMGKHEIQGEAVFALAMKAPSRAPEAGQFESHRDYRLICLSTFSLPSANPDSPLDLAIDCVSDEVRPALSLVAQIINRFQRSLAERGLHDLPVKILSVCRECL
jgi:hypothetical protein